MHMDTTFLLGLIGSLILVSGAAYPEQKVLHPARSAKNWLFAIGGLCMFGYSLFNYLDGGPIFFLILQIFILISSVLMMLNTPDRLDVPLLSVIAFGLIIWSLTLFEDYTTLIFIVGLCSIGIGYALKRGRDAALMFGSALIALFSYLEASWLFFWLNLFFAAFSGFYLWKPALKPVSAKNL